MKLKSHFSQNKNHIADEMLLKLDLCDIRNKNVILGGILVLHSVRKKLHNKDEVQLHKQFLCKLIFFPSIWSILFCVSFRIFFCIAKTKNDIWLTLMGHITFRGKECQIFHLFLQLLGRKRNCTYVMQNKSLRIANKL